MSENNRIPLFVRVLPNLKSGAAEAANRRRVSVSRYVEDAILAQLRRDNPWGRDAKRLRDELDQMLEREMGGSGILE